MSATSPRPFFRVRHGLVAATCVTAAWLGACASSSPSGTGGTGTGGAATGGSATGGAATGGAATGGAATGGAATGGAATGGAATGGAQGGAKGGNTATTGGSAGGAAGGKGGSTSSGGGSSGTITLTSTAYMEGGMIPKENSCSPGADTSPPLAWTGAPSTAKSFTLVFRDLDNPTVMAPTPFVHWVLWDIPTTPTNIPAPVDETSANPSNVSGAHQHAYGSAFDFKGPCPPTGTHNYRFTIYAIPTDKLTVAANATADQVAMAAQQQAVASGSLTGKGMKPQ